MFKHRRRIICNCLTKHHYCYGMTRAAFINRFKIHISIDGKKYAAYKCKSCISRIVYLQPYCNQHLGHETLSMRTINTGIHRVCQIEFTKEIYQEQKILFFMEKFVGCTDF